MADPTEPEAAPSTPGWGTLVVIALAAALTVVVADLALQRVSPVRHKTEVEDALASLPVPPPRILAIGSSHGRTFEAVHDELARRSDGALGCVAIPVEFGKWTSYEWVLRHRVGPEMEPGVVRHLVLITEWWDSTPPPVVPGAHGRAQNLPSRAWTLRDFAADVVDEGLTPFNRNYLTERFRRLFHNSVLVQDRGYGRILEDAKDAVRPRDRAVDRRNFELQGAGWRQNLVAGAADIFHPDQTAAMDRILDWAAERDLEVTVLLYPRMPITIPEQALDPGGTLAAFARGFRERYGDRVARIVDATTTSPLTDDDFAEDFDHLTAPGHRTLARWLLDGPLAFLLEGH